MLGRGCRHTGFDRRLSFILFDGDASKQSLGLRTCAVRVTAAPPVRKTLRRESVQPGQIEAFEFTPLFAKLASYVQKLYVDIGDRVEADQPIVDLFLPELKDELRQKEAALVQAQAEIELAAAAVRAAEAAVATAAGQHPPGGGRHDPRRGGCRALAVQYTRISQLVADGSLDRKLEDETRNSLKAAEAARGRGPRESGSGQGHVARKARLIWPRQRPTKPWPAPATETPKPTCRESRPFCSTRKSAPRMPESSPSGT